MVEDIEAFPIGSLVQTPTGRIGVVADWTYGKRGDFPRCLVRYLDSRDRRECARLLPRYLTVLIRVAVFVKAVRGWMNDDEEQRQAVEHS